jgi:hypothetical protein
VAGAARAHRREAGTKHEGKVALVAHREQRLGAPAGAMSPTNPKPLDTNLAVVKYKDGSICTRPDDENTEDGTYTRFILMCNVGVRARPVCHSLTTSACCSLALDSLRCRA